MRGCISNGHQIRGVKYLDFHSQEVVKFAIVIQYKSLKLDRNGGKSTKSKTSFVASPTEDLNGCY